jgi:hypothetical protein
MKREAVDTEPARLPTDTAALLLPSTLCETRQRTNVSDSHIDRSHRVCPAPLYAVYVARPMLAPCIVTLATPVAALLALRMTLSRVRSGPPRRCMARHGIRFRPQGGSRDG